MHTDGKDTVGGRMRKAERKVSTAVRVRIIISDQIVMMKYPGAVPPDDEIISQAQRRAATAVLRNHQETSRGIILERMKEKL